MARPVNGSWKDWRVSSRSSRRRSVTSRRVTTSPRTVGSARRSRQDTSTWITVPSVIRSRQSTLSARYPPERTRSSNCTAISRSPGSTRSTRLVPAGSAPMAATAEGLAYPIRL